MFRTGQERRFPDVDTEADWYGLLPHAGDVAEKVVFELSNFATSSRDADGTAVLLRSNDYKHYVDYFNQMEDENIVQAIPNSEAWAWMP